MEHGRLEFRVIKIRPATEADMEFAVAIYNEVVVNSTATFEENVRSLQDFITPFRQKQENGIPWIVAEDRGRVIAYGTYGQFRNASGYRPTVEHSLHIVPEFRGQGLGSAILRELMALAKQNGHTSMIAGLDSSNSASIALHKKFGFEKVGEIPRVAHKFGRWLDLLFMQVNL